MLRIKALIRWSEAKAGALVCGCREEHLHFLDLPFYRTGTIAKNPVGEEDVRLIRELLDRVRPHQVYIAGDLSDPHGTHRVCAEAIIRTLNQIESETGGRPEALLYRGAWQEWPPHEIDIAVPLHPRDLKQKKAAIFRHESQKDSALFPGPECANSGSEPRIAIGTRPTFTINSASPSSMRSRASSAGVARPSESLEPRPARPSTWVSPVDGSSLCAAAPRRIFAGTAQVRSSPRPMCTDAIDSVHAYIIFKA